MLLRIYPENPNPKEIKKVVDCLKNGGVIIYPTDTVYGIGCDVNNKKAMERVCRIKELDIKKHNLAFVCYDLSHISVNCDIALPCATQNELDESRN